MSQGREFEVVIVGSGPAGLSAAINIASEGRRVAVVDASDRPGGQADASTLVENYPGFPQGISGQELMMRCITQARHFGVTFHCPLSVRGLRLEGNELLVPVDDHALHHLRARAVVLALGLKYNRLTAENVSIFTGRGVSYMRCPTELRAPDKCVCIVGGANSAGQAAMSLAAAGCRVKLIVREDRLQMSNYLVERIRGHMNIEVFLGSQVESVNGDDWLTQVTIISQPDASGHRGLEKIVLRVDGMCVFIGASPKTYWLNGIVTQVKDRGFILTGRDVGDGKDR